VPEQDLYAILQVEPGAAPEVVDAAYRALARLHHPDVSAAPDAAERMRALNEAYRVYDARRAMQTPVGDSRAGHGPRLQPAARPIDLFSAAVADVWQRRPRRGTRTEEPTQRGSAGNGGSRRAALPLLALGAGAAGALGGGVLAPFVTTSSEERAVRAYWGVASGARAVVEVARARLLAVPGVASPGGFAVVAANTAFGPLAAQLIADLEGAATRLRAAPRVPGAAETYHFLQLDGWREEREIRLTQRDALQARNADVWTNAVERELLWRASPQYVNLEAAAWELAARAAR
jgi:hypothetical protein